MSFTGSLEYGGPKPGQLLGGRWKPLHYWYRQSIFAPVMATCGLASRPPHDHNPPLVQCYAKNDLQGKTRAPKLVEVKDSEACPLKVYEEYVQECSIRRSARQRATRVW